MRVDAFDFDLPEERIAQHPPQARGESRLLRLDRRSGAIRHHEFRDVVDLLEPGDLLVVNDTRVIPARIDGTKETGGQVEVLLVEPTGKPTVWKALVRSSRAPKPGSRLSLAGGIRARVLRIAGGEAELEFETPGGDLETALDSVGRMPLPPYIRREEAGAEEVDRERYQTVYARESGAVAAPTAGLHFTPELLQKVQERGVFFSQLTLHVGLGTFQPVRVDEVEAHAIHSERFELSDRLAAQIEATRERGGRVVAVGTTVVRTLEHQARGEEGQVSPGRGRCELFIYPGFRFRVVDAMITNFHLPRSTLLMLVAAFTGREKILEAYREAVQERYRFYSYGDAMWIG